MGLSDQGGWKNMRLDDPKSLVCHATWRLVIVLLRKFSQQCCLSFMSSGLRRHVVGPAVP